MNKRTRVTSLALALIAILLLATGSAAAKATKIEFSYTQFTCSTGTPERMWFSGETPEGPALHWRGMPSIARLVSTDADAPWWFDGAHNPAVGNADVKFPAYTGHVHGTFVLEFDNKPGTIEGTWGGKMINGILSFTGIGHGAGGLGGTKFRVDLVQLTEIPPGDLCPERALYAYAATAELVDTHGE